MTEEKKVRVVVRYLPTQKLNKLGEAPKFRVGSQRQVNFDMITDGMTVEAYKAKAGDEATSFLAFYVQQGLVEVV